MSKDGLGGLAKRWLNAKVKEMTTADRRTRIAAEGEVEATERRLHNEAIGEAVLTAVPGLRRWRDQQEANAAAAEDERERRTVERLSRLPTAAVTMRTSGAVDASWSGELPVSIEPVSGDGYSVVLEAIPGREPEIAGRTFTGWRFEVPGDVGAGRHDLAAVGRARQAAGDEPDYLEWQFGLGEEGFFFQPDAGPSTVTVDGSSGPFHVAMSLVGSAGSLAVEAEIAVAE